MGDPTAKNSLARPGAKPLIFIVDDEPILLELAAGILASAGYESKTFTDPSTALRAFTAANPPPDLVITDYAMGGVTGTDLIRECRRIHPRQKIILLSGTADESVFSGLAAKPDRFMSKPYGANDLINIVKAVLAS